MRYMIIVKATAGSEAGEMAPASFTAQMADFHEQLAHAGVLLDAGRLKPTSQGWRIRHHGAEHSVIEGPFAGSGEPMAGYTLIQVRSREEALEWSRRFPAPPGVHTQAEIEVRALYEPGELRTDDAAARLRMQAH